MYALPVLPSISAVAASEHQGRMRCQEKSRPKKIPIQRILYRDQTNIESRFIRSRKLQMNQ